MSAERLVKDWRKLIPADSLTSIALSLICFHLAQQRSIVPPLPTVKLHDHLCEALEVLRDRGLPIPHWPHPFRFSDALTAALLDRLPRDSPVELLAQVYELLQRPEQKQSQGSFYTPIAIADYLVSQSICLPQPRLLDPACGGGVLLLRAYAKLLETHAACDRFSLLQRCIFGVDVDAEAVAIAQISLLLQAAEGYPDVSSRFPDLSQNICCGNAVIHPIAPMLEANSFDAVISNPPYLDAERMTIDCPNWRRYCTKTYRSAKGNWDLFCVFIEQGLNLCRPGGITSMIVPNKLISADYAAEARSLLCQENHLLSLRDYSRISVFAASVYPIVYVAQKHTPTRSATVRYEVMGTSPEEHWLSYNRFSLDRPWLLTTERSHLTRLQSLPTLETVAQVSGAATVAEAYLLQPFITEAQTDDEIRFINSGTIDRYQIRWGEKPLRYLGNVFDRPTVRLPIDPRLSKRLLQARQPKLIVAGMTRQLECAIDLEGNIWPGKSTCVIRSPLDLRYLLGLINSRVVDSYFNSLFQGNCLQGGYLRIGSPQLRQLPMPLEDSHRHDRLIAIVQARLDNPSDAAKLDAQIETLVCELYHLTDGEVAALQSP